MPAGKDIVEEYIEHLYKRCIESEGDILVADVENEIAGYTLVLAKVVSEEIDDGGLEYGLIADLVVMRKFRGLGIGGQLLDAAESYAKSRSVKWLRIGVLAENNLARELYQSRGFRNYYIELEKDLGINQTSA
jgi:ribosomal protein S18 acetylase RimI-like enzyme